LRLGGRSPPLAPPLATPLLILLSRLVCLDPRLQNWHFLFWTIVGYCLSQASGSISTTNLDCSTIIIVTLDMSEELRALRDMARKFSREEILPVAAEHDRTGEVEILTFVSILCYLTCIFIFACFVLLVSLEDHQESSWPWSTQYTCPRRIWYVTNRLYADV
jgi:hypothetical protein